MSHEFISDAFRKGLFNQIGTILVAHGQTPEGCDVRPERRRVILGAGFMRPKGTKLSGAEVYVEEMIGRSGPAATPNFPMGRGVYTGYYRSDQNDGVFRARRGFLITPNNAYSVLDAAVPRSVRLDDGQEVLQMLKKLEEAAAIFGVVRIIQG